MPAPYRRPLRTFVRGGFAATAALALLAASCGGGDGDDRLTIGATTSLQDSGLLEVLIEAFEEDAGADVAGITPRIASSGQVIEMARRGEVDVIITHSPDAERRLVADGHGVERRPVMHNFFLLVGPPDDPAGTQSVRTLAEAFRLIALDESAFVSRGDESGTHVRELALWQEAGIDPAGQPWYEESGSGQGHNLVVASDRAAYTLADSGTFAVFWGRIDLEPFVTDPEPNQYSVTRVNPDKHGEVNEALARAFADWLTSAAAQRIIAAFGAEEYGRPLFAADNPIEEATPVATGD